MRDVSHSRGFKTLLGIIFVVLGIMIYSTGAEDGSVFPSFLGHIFTPMQKVSTVISSSTAASVGRSADDLKSKNQELKEGVDALYAKLIDYYQIKQENDQYRIFLGLRNENKDLTFVFGSVVGRDPNDVFGSFIVDEGSLAGVTAGSPVVTESGTVGWVSSISSTSYWVATLSSPDTNMTALDRVNRKSGMVSSSIKLYEQGYAELGYLPSETRVQKDDIIATSGLGGICPRNLPVSKVVSVGPEEYSVSYMAVIKPFVDPKTVRGVSIITNFLGKGEALSSLPEPSGTPSGGNTSSSSGTTSSSTASGSRTAK